MMELVVKLDHLVVRRMDQMMEFDFARNLVALVVKY